MRGNTRESIEKTFCAFNKREGSGRSRNVIWKVE